MDTSSNDNKEELSRLVISTLFFCRQVYFFANSDLSVKHEIFEGFVAEYKTLNKKIFPDIFSLEFNKALKAKQQKNCQSLEASKMY